MEEVGGEVIESSGSTLWAFKQLVKGLLVGEGSFEILPCKRAAWALPSPVFWAARAALTKVAQLGGGRCVWYTDRWAPSLSKELSYTGVERLARFLVPCQAINHRLPALSRRRGLGHFGW